MRIQPIVKFNEWWSAGKVPDDLLLPYRRPIYQEMVNYLENRQALTLIGLRRVGKTVLFYQLVQHMLDRGINKENILYFNFDDEAGDVREVLEAYRETILKRGWRDIERVYVFFDEIHKVKNWENKVKVVYDLYPNLKFFLSGSASLFIEKKTKESLAGRAFDFYLAPLNFKEFVALKGFELPKLPEDVGESYKLLAPFEDKLRLLFNEYLVKGGFPEVVPETNERKIKAYIRNSVIDRIAYADIPKTFKVDEPELLMNILKFIAENPGCLVNYQKLARNFGVNRKTVSNHFFYLQKSFLVKMLPNFRRGFIASARKMKKAYLCDTGLISALTGGGLDEAFLGKLVENLAANHPDAKSFWRTPQKSEVDVILRGKEKLGPLEVKYRSAVETGELKGLVKFMKNFNCDRGHVITKDLLEKRTVEGKEILFVPAWLFFLLGVLTRS
jgi:predicted AAA+ superfamily ATPase